MVYLRSWIWVIWGHLGTSLGRVDSEVNLGQFWLFLDPILDPI